MIATSCNRCSTPGSVAAALRGVVDHLVAAPSVRRLPGQSQGAAARQARAHAVRELPPYHAVLRHRPCRLPGLIGSSRSARRYDARRLRRPRRRVCAQRVACRDDRHRLRRRVVGVERSRPIPDQVARAHRTQPTGPRPVAWGRRTSRRRCSRFRHRRVAIAVGGSQPVDSPPTCPCSAAGDWLDRSHLFISRNTAEQGDECYAIADARSVDRAAGRRTRFAVRTCDVGRPVDWNSCSSSRRRCDRMPVNARSRSRCWSAAKPFYGIPGAGGLAGAQPMLNARGRIRRSTAALAWRCLR